MPDPRMNAWLQRLSVATIALVAAALLGTGASLILRAQAPAVQAVAVESGTGK